MSKSLQEQLLGANLIDKKKAKKISKENKKAKNEKIRSKENILSDAQLAAQKAKQEKIEHDIALNKKRQEDADKRAISAQVEQMVKHYRLERKQGEKEYQFKDGTTIKKILLTDDIYNEIIRGRLCIAKIKNSYEIIPHPVAEKILERDSSAIIVNNKTNTANTKDTASSDTTSDDDFYAQFALPDDLDW